MSITFHDGTHKLYSAYAGRPWNDVGLLRLSTRDYYHRWLMTTYNHEAAIRALFAGPAVQHCYPFGAGKSKLGEWVGAEHTGIVILKGLHHWRRIDDSWDYQLHLSFGLDGRLWHLNALYHDATHSVSLTADCTPGEWATQEDHEGFRKA